MKTFNISKYLALSIELHFKEKLHIYILYRSTHELNNDIYTYICLYIDLNYIMSQGIWGKILHMLKK